MEMFNFGASVGTIQLFKCPRLTNANVWMPAREEKQWKAISVLYMYLKLHRPPISTTLANISTLQIPMIEHHNSYQAVITAHP